MFFCSDCTGEFAQVNVRVPDDCYKSSTEQARDGNSLSVTLTVDDSSCLDMALKVSLELAVILLDLS